MYYDNKISMVVAAYNNTDTIERCLDSIYNQIYRNFEVILVDDCSPDVEYSYLKRKYENLKLIRLSENKGPGVARQTGLDHATGDWVMFIDQDDELLDCYVLVHVNHMCNDYKESGIIRCHLMQIINSEYGQAMVIPSISEMRPLHGMIFNLRFIRNNNIRFHNTLRCHEDTYFYLLSKYTLKYSTDVLINFVVELPTIIYKYNKTEKSITQTSYGMYTFFEYTIYDLSIMFIDLSKRLDEVVHENDLLDLLFSVIINLVLLYKILSIECDELFHIKEFVMTRIKMIGLNIFSHIRERFGIYTKDDLYNIFSIYYERDPLNIIKEHKLSSYARDNLYPILDTLYTFYLENSHDIS